MIKHFIQKIKNIWMSPITSKLDTINNSIININYLTKQTKKYIGNKYSIKNKYE